MGHSATFPFCACRRHSRNRRSLAVTKSVAATITAGAPLWANTLPSQRGRVHFNAALGTCLASDMLTHDTSTSAIRFANPCDGCVVFLQPVKRSPAKRKRCPAVSDDTEAAPAAADGEDTDCLASRVATSSSAKRRRSIAKWKSSSEEDGDVIEISDDDENVGANCSRLGSSKDQEFPVESIGQHLLDTSYSKLTQQSGAMKDICWSRHPCCQTASVLITVPSMGESQHVPVERRKYFFIGIWPFHGPRQKPKLSVVVACYH